MDASSLGVLKVRLDGTLRPSWQDGVPADGRGVEIRQYLSPFQTKSLDESMILSFKVTNITVRPKKHAPGTAGKPSPLAVSSSQAITMKQIVVQRRFKGSILLLCQVIKYLHALVSTTFIFSP